MSVSPRRTSLSEFALRVVTRPAKGDWFVLAIQSDRLADVQESLADEIGAISTIRPITTSDVQSARDLVRAVRRSLNSILLIGGIERFSEVEWRSVDLMRSSLEGPRTVVFLASPNQLQILAKSAPNLASWLTGGIWELDEQIERLSEAEREERLSVLRSSTGMTDEDVIRAAEDGALSSEPQFVEWLLLLGRVDLIERR